LSGLKLKDWRSLREDQKKLPGKRLRFLRLMRHQMINPYLISINQTPNLPDKFIKHNPNKQKEDSQYQP